MRCVHRDHHSEMCHHHFESGIGYQWKLEKPLESQTCVTVSFIELPGNKKSRTRSRFCCVQKPHTSETPKSVPLGIRKAVSKWKTTEIYHDFPTQHGFVFQTKGYTQMWWQNQSYPIIFPIKTALFVGSPLFSDTQISHDRLCWLKIPQYHRYSIHDSFYNPNECWLNLPYPDSDAETIVNPYFWWLRPPVLQPPWLFVNNTPSAPAVPDATAWWPSDGSSAAVDGRSHAQPGAPVTKNGGWLFLTEMKWGTKHIENGEDKSMKSCDLSIKQGDSSIKIGDPSRIGDLTSKCGDFNQHGNLGTFFQQVADEE